MTPPERPIHLPRSRAASSPGGSAKRSPAAKRRRRRPLHQFLVGLGLSALGAAVLVALLHLPAWLDTLLLVSTAINNLLLGLTKLILALLQFAALVLLVAVALAGLLCLVAGVMRMGKAFWPMPSGPSGND